MRCILCHLSAWGCGHSRTLTTPDGSPPMRTILAESADLLPAILDSDLCNESTAIFCPSSDTPTGIGETIVAPCTGSLGAPGDEMVVGDVFVVKVQEYILTPYLEIDGPTFARITSEKDFYAFLDHADQAKQHGVFPPALLHPMMRLGDLCALGGAHTCGGPGQRLFVRASGEASTTPQGMPLGFVTDGLASLTSAWSAIRRPPGSGCPGCLTGAVRTPTLRIAHQQRPWLSRYLCTLDALRTAATEGLTNLKVSGFPHRMTAAADQYTQAVDLTLVGAELPVLLFNTAIALIHDPHSNQQFQVGTGTARLLELLMIYGDEDAAIAAATHHLGLAPHAAREALAQVMSGLSDFGMQLLPEKRCRSASSIQPGHQGAAAQGVNTSCWLSAMGAADSRHSWQPVPGPRASG
ncbi:daptide biosynthesis RiPP recognition protein [Streptomyces sp. NPDC007205]|uniref:daptide biosynthesis RiPP recognition protein n=1 Tax=Streptomyces sp. NPDC007205 TaxID=3154316 RepID=UPI0033D59EFA